MKDILDISRAMCKRAYGDEYPWMDPKQPVVNAVRTAKEAETTKKDPSGVQVRSTQAPPHMVEQTTTDLKPTDASILAARTAGGNADTAWKEKTGQEALQGDGPNPMHVNLIRGLDSDQYAAVQAALNKRWPSNQAANYMRHISEPDGSIKPAYRSGFFARLMGKDRLNREARMQYDRLKASDAVRRARVEELLKEYRETGRITSWAGGTRRSVQLPSPTLLAQDNRQGYYEGLNSTADAWEHVFNPTAHPYTSDVFRQYQGWLAEQAEEARQKAADVSAYKNMLYKAREAALKSNPGMTDAERDLESSLLAQGYTPSQVKFLMDRYRLNPGRFVSPENFDVTEHR